MKVLILLLVAFWADPYELHVNEENYGSLTELTAIPFPEKIKIASEKDLKVEITVVAAGRKIYSVEMRTNETHPLRSFQSASKLHVKIFDGENTFTHDLDIEKAN